MSSEVLGLRFYVRNSVIVKEITAEQLLQEHVSYNHNVSCPRRFSLVLHHTEMYYKIKE